MHVLNFSNVTKIFPRSLHFFIFIPFLQYLYTNNFLFHMELSMIFFFSQECPLALEAAEGLLSLGVKGMEVNALVFEGLSGFGNLDW